VLTAYFCHPYVGLVVAVAAFVSLVADGRRSLREARPTLGRKISLGVCAVVFAGYIVAAYWRIDAPPIRDHWGMSDLRSAPLECEGSFELLMSLADANDSVEGAPAIGFSAADVNDLRRVWEVIKAGDLGKTRQALDDEAAVIVRLWDRCARARAVVEQLDEYAEIADMSTPSLSPDNPYPFLKNMRYVIWTHQVYACLKSHQGHVEEAVTTLAQINRLARGFDKNARTPIGKITCIATFGMDVGTAAFVANGTEVSEAQLERLLAEFSPVRDECLSLRNMIIFEHLYVKKLVDEMFDEAGRHRRRKLAVMLKYNSTLRLHRRLCEQWLETDGCEPVREAPTGSVWPTVYPKPDVSLGLQGEVPWYYWAYNPLGSQVAQLMIHYREAIGKLKTQMRVHADLLCILIDKRLGREVDLRARAYSEAYVVDKEAGRISSCGPDGQLGTKDDIWLAFDPNVVRF